MADVSHSALTGAELHEPKGIATANDGEIYIANGLGSGDWTSPGGAIFGELQAVGNTTPLSVTAAATSIDTDADYIRVNVSGLWSAGEATGTTLNTAGGYITVPTAGLYEISYWSSFNANAIGAVTAFKFSSDDTNGSLSSRRLTRKSGSATDIGVVSASGFVNLAANSKISLWVASDTTVNLTIYDAGITLTLLKAT